MFFCVYEWKRAFGSYNLFVLPLRTVKEAEDKKKKQTKSRDEKGRKAAICKQQRIKDLLKASLYIFITESNYMKPWQHSQLSNG